MANAAAVIAATAAMPPVLGRAVTRTHHWTSCYIPRTSCSLMQSTTVCRQLRACSSSVVSVSPTAPDRIAFRSGKIRIVPVFYGATCSANNNETKNSGNGPFRLSPAVNFSSAKNYNNDFLARSTIVPRKRGSSGLLFNFLSRRNYNSTTNTTTTHSERSDTHLSVTAHFKHLMAEMNLQPSAPQEKLLANLEKLQHAIEKSEAENVFDKRFKIAVNELRETYEKPAPKKWTSLLASPIRAVQHTLQARGGANIVIPPEGSSAAPTELPLCANPWPDVLQSIYIWGGVGQGKTLLMNAFFDSVNIQRKMRMHFHNLMLEVQERLHELRVSKEPMPFDRRGWDSILHVAYQIAKSHKLICLDEFYVVHITDAMILRRLFEALLHFGCVVVTTSNRVPSDLYENGLNRARFIPFINLVNTHWKVVELDVGCDWRRTKSGPNDRDTVDRLLCSREQPDGTISLAYSPPRPFKAVLNHLAQLGNGQIEYDYAIRVAMGRELLIPYKSGDCCAFEFEDLCVKPTAAADYIALADHFHTVLLHGIPPLDDFASQGNEIRRFIQLIDVLYERHVRVIFDSVNPIQKPVASCESKENLTVVDDNRFAIDRTLSRITEMLSTEYNSDHITAWRQSARVG